MGLYHGVDHYEQMKISDKSWTEPFVKGWPDLLQSQTVFRFAWSYIIAWVGVGMCLGSCVLFFMASMCIRSDKRREEAMNMQYLMPGNANFSKKKPKKTRQIIRLLISMLTKLAWVNKVSV